MYRSYSSGVECVKGVPVSVISTASWLALA
jgi:hypothetical protein